MRLLAPPLMTVSCTDVIEKIKNKKHIVRGVEKVFEKEEIRWRSPGTAYDGSRCCNDPNDFY